MNSRMESRTELKRKAIMDAALGAFLDKGYDGATMDDVAALAGVSKPTLYKHFADKERLYAEIVRATADDIDGLVHLVSAQLADATDVGKDLTKLASKLIAALMQPKLLRLRRLVIANAERFPAVGRAWYAQGFERVLATLAACFQHLGERGLLRVSDPLLAANHFVGLLLWIPLNKAMFSGDLDSNATELERHAKQAVRAFLAGYGCT